MLLSKNRHLQEKSLSQVWCHWHTNTHYLGGLGRKSRAQGHSQLQSKFKASLSYMRHLRLCLNNNNNNNRMTCRSHRVCTMCCTIFSSKNQKCNQQERHLELAAATLPISLSILHHSHLGISWHLLLWKGNTQSQLWAVENFWEIPAGTGLLHWAATGYLREKAASCVPSEEREQKPLHTGSTVI